MSREQRHTWRSLAPTLTRLLASERLLYGILALFVLQALWFAFTAKYPMAFDENYHFGLIQLHANQWLPFFTHQPAHAEAYGPVARDPSYLYHYLLSLPYRVIRLFTANQTAQIITLRILNIGLAAVSFLLFRRLLSRLGASAALSNTVLLIFCLIPVVPFLAAHINYDNLFILLAVYALLLAFDWFDDVSTHRLSAARTLGLATVLLTGCLVKYAYLPIALAIVLLMAWQVWRQRGFLPHLLESFKQSFRASYFPVSMVLSILLLIVTSLFAERYAVNLIKYHSPSPDCGKVLSIDSCLSYSPWARNFTYEMDKPANYSPSKASYPKQWVEGMWSRSFFAISDTYDTRDPLPIPGETVAIVGAIGVLLFLWYSRTILRSNIYRQTALLALLLYTVALFLQTFEGYIQTGVPVAINGRYLVPFLPVILLFLGLAFRNAWRRRAELKPLAAVAIILLLLQGGGVLTFIVRSDDSWDWPNPAVVRVNDVARKVLTPIIVGAHSKS